MYPQISIVLFSLDNTTVKVQWWLWHMAHPNRRWFIRPQWSIKSPVISNLSLDIYFHTFCLIDSFLYLPLWPKETNKILFHIRGVTIKKDVLIFFYSLMIVSPPRVLFNKFFLLLLLKKKIVFKIMCTIHLLGKETEKSPFFCCIWDFCKCHEE